MTMTDMHVRPPIISWLVGWLVGWLVVLLVVLVSHTLPHHRVLVFIFVWHLHRSYRPSLRPSVPYSLTAASLASTLLHFPV